MIFECKKTENCFVDSRTYEYRLPVKAEDFKNLLENDWQIRCNLKLRRPVFLAEKEEIKIKGILAGDIIRVSFREDQWEVFKENFEKYLETL